MRDDGSVILRSPQPLRDFPRNLGSLLAHWAATVPERVFLAERDGQGGWRKLGYAEAARAAASVAQSLIDRGLDQSRPVLVLSGNGIDHALLMMGCFLAGVPLCPVSPAYSLLSTEFGKVKYVRQLIDPALIYVDAFEPFQAALAAIGVAGVEMVSSSALPQGIAGTKFADLLATAPTHELRRRVESVSLDDVAKILLTSGSTGVPKAVVTTHRMLSANQQMLRQIWPFLETMPPLLLDWLPWNHVFGGNHNFNMVLRNGGTLYVDAGRPSSGYIEQTVSSLREVSPNIYFNVPAGYAMLLPYLENDDELASSFLRDLKLIFYAAAALPQDLWERLERLSVRHLGRRVPITSSWGSTETAPLATSAHFPLQRAGVIGLPVPGVEIKMVPAGTKMELRVRGPNVTPGYYKRPDLTREAFDEEGFYRVGDAGRFADSTAPEQGLIFDGRIAEDFKLGTGTWVHVGALRLAALAACSPVFQDVVICGHDGEKIGLLAWLNVSACEQIVGRKEASWDPETLARAPEVRDIVRRGLARHNQANPAASTRITRVYVMAEPPSIDANEITDKGYINQRAVVERRTALVRQLFADPPGPDVIVWP
jgi:feruloyl-CoA synthase